MGLMLATAAGARLNGGPNVSSGGNPYHAIMDRNIFDIRPVPPPPAPAQQGPPPPNVKLVGLMDITGHPQAVIQTQEPGAPAKLPTTQMFKEGQRRGAVEVKEIDMSTKMARVEVDGNLLVLKLEAAKAAPPAAGPGPAVAGGPRPGFTPAVPGAIPRSPDAAANPTAIPPRPVRSDNTDNSQLTADQQLILIEAQRAAYIQQNNPLAQILPPTPYTSRLNPQAAGDQASAAPSLPTMPTMPTPKMPQGWRTTGSLNGVVPPPPPAP